MALEKAKQPERPLFRELLLERAALDLAAETDRGIRLGRGWFAFLFTTSEFLPEDYPCQLPPAAMPTLFPLLTDDVLRTAQWGSFTTDTYRHLIGDAPALFPKLTTWSEIGRWHRIKAVVLSSFSFEPKFEATSFALSESYGSDYQADLVRAVLENNRQVDFIRPLAFV